MGTCLGGGVKGLKIRMRKKRGREAAAAEEEAGLQTCSSSTFSEPKLKKGSFIPCSRFYYFEKQFYEE